jgi:hypothetical protein
VKGLVVVVVAFAEAEGEAEVVGLVVVLLGSTKAEAVLREPFVEAPAGLAGAI